MRSAFSETGDNAVTMDGATRPKCTKVVFPMKFYEMYVTNNLAKPKSLNYTYMTYDVLLL